MKRSRGVTCEWCGAKGRVNPNRRGHKWICSDCARQGLETPTGHKIFKES